MQENELLDELVLSTKYSTKAIIGFWEQKRLWYNLYVGVAGLSMTALHLYYIEDLSVTIPYYFAIAIYGIAANAAFTLGWGLELYLRKYLEWKISHHFSTICFNLGTFFSVILTLLIGLAFLSLATSDF